MAEDVLGSPDAGFDVQLHGLSAVVYAERGDEILLLKRAGGALSGHWFLPAVLSNVTSCPRMARVENWSTRCAGLAVARPPGGPHRRR